MAIAVTGGAGYIGSHMVHTLLDRGECVVVLDNLSIGFEWAVPRDAPLVVGDAGDGALVAKVIAAYGVEAIIHFADSRVISDSLTDALGYYRNNTSNSRTLIECAVKGGVKRFIFSSTAAVYGNQGGIPVGEDAPTLPMSPYGAAPLIKVAVETSLQVRASMKIFGTDYPTKDGTCIRDYVHVVDSCAPISTHSDICAEAVLRRRSTAAMVRASPCFR
jgi:UDP-glucose 4-epimerase